MPIKAKLTSQQKPARVGPSQTNLPFSLALCVAATTAFASHPRRHRPLKLLFFEVFPPGIAAFDSEAADPAPRAADLWAATAVHSLAAPCSRRLAGTSGGTAHLHLHQGIPCGEEKARLVVAMNESVVGLVHDDDTGHHASRRMRHADRRRGSAGRPLSPSGPAGRNVNFCPTRISPAGFSTPEMWNKKRRPAVCSMRKSKHRTTSKRGTIPT